MTQLLPRANAGPLVGQPRSAAAAAAAAWPRGGLRPLVQRSVLQRPVTHVAAASSSRSKSKAGIADPALLRRGPAAAAATTSSEAETATASESASDIPAAAPAPPPPPAAAAPAAQAPRQAAAAAAAVLIDAREQATSESEQQPSREQYSRQQQQQQLGQAVPSIGSAIFKGTLDAAFGEEPAHARQQYAAVDPLPHKNFGNLRGGQYPFLYDPVYGLPIVHDVAKYGEVLRDIRTGLVQELLWFFEPNHTDSFAGDGRCLVRYKDGRVRQSVVPLQDFRVPYAMQAHGVKATKVPLEPRYVAEYAAFDEPPSKNPLDGPIQRQMAYHEVNVRHSRRGPRIGPSFEEELLSLPTEEREAFLLQQQDDIDRVVGNLERAGSEEWDWYTGKTARPSEAREGQQRMEQPEAKKSWSDKIIVSQDMQVLIYKWVPIVGPILGSAFVIGLYIAARLLRGDLTDRMKMMDEGDEKRRRTALKEARIAFLEEEIPALVARKTDMAVIKRKLAEVNKKLGEKFEISDTELASTVEACSSLLAEGQDLDTGEGATQAAERILAEEDAAASRAAAEGGEGGGGEGAASGADALMEMGKLNTARIRKAVDPKILDVKKRVRAARRSLKRESKVVLSDEIIFFDDVAGNEQAKVELMEVVDFFRKPEKFRASGARPPKGVLLVGPPGNGKTLMARAVAGESGVAFISSSASEFIEMYMGLGAARVRDLFNTARKLSPCIIFIDELDAVGRARRSGSQGGNDERDNTVNQLLTELDGFSAETQGIVVMGATNRKDVLDPALTRPGRFDRSIEVRRPDYQGRLEGIKVHLREKPIAADIDYGALAALTGGMSGAQLAGVCNTACFLASRAGRTEVAQADLVAAVEQTKYGKTYEASKFVSPGRKQRFAVVEAGFCVAAALLPALEPIEYVTILPSIKSPVGRTVLKPNVGRYTTGVWTRQYLQQQLRMVLAGRAAEELVYGIDEMSSLHQHRIMQARQIVHKMLQAGFSTHPDFEHIRGLGSAYQDPSMEPNRFTSFITVTDHNQSRSEWVDVDMEMEAMLNGAYAEVKEMLSRNRGALDALAAALLAKESMQGGEVYAVLEGHLSSSDRQQREEALESMAFM